MMCDPPSVCDKCGGSTYSFNDEQLMTHTRICNWPKADLIDDIDDIRDWYV